MAEGTSATTRPADTGLLSPGWAGTGVDELLDDHAIVAAMVSVEVALARAQAACGVIPERSAEVIAEVGADRLDLHRIARSVRDTANPVVEFVALLVDAVAEHDVGAAEDVHRGCTSQDVLDSALMLVCSRTLTRMHRDLARTADALAGLAREHRGTVMAGRTLTQHAVPTTFGLRAATWLQLVLDARERVRRILDGGLPASLGGAAGTLAAYHEYATLAGVPGDGAIELGAPFAATLGLAEPLVPWHSVRTPILDVAAVLVFVTGALGKLAVDVQVLGRTELGEVAEGAAPGRGTSSAMPQKRNPVFATMIATAARQVPAYASVLNQSMMVEDERSAGGWHAEWQPMREGLRLTAGACGNAIALVEGLEVFPERMHANLALTGGALVAERMSAVLAPELGKKEAKRLLTAATAEAAGSGRSVADTLTDLAAEHGHRLDPATVCELLRPEGYLGVAESLVDRVLARHRAGR